MRRPMAGTRHRPGPTQALRRARSTSTACEPGPRSPPTQRGPSRPQAAASEPPSIRAGRASPRHHSRHCPCPPRATARWAPTRSPPYAPTPCPGPHPPPSVRSHALAPGRSSSLVLVLPGKAPLWLLPLLGQHEAQLLVGGEGGQGAVQALAGLCGVPVALPAQVGAVAAGCPLVVVPACGALA